jgi:hypothetical protein
MNMKMESVLWSRYMESIALLAIVVTDMTARCNISEHITIYQKDYLQCRSLKEILLVGCLQRCQSEVNSDIQDSESG